MDMTLTLHDIPNVCDRLHYYLYYVQLSVIFGEIRKKIVDIWPSL